MKRCILIPLLLTFLGCPDRSAQTPSPAPDDGPQDSELAADDADSEPTDASAPTPAVPSVEATDSKTREISPEMAERLRAQAKSKGQSKKGVVEPPEIDLSCTVASDCEIKNVGNCCGYYPRCVNKDFEPNPEAVKAKCEREGMMGVCGFPEIRSCACEKGQCVSLSTSAE